MLQLGDPVPLIGLSLWICWYVIYIFLDKDSPINIVMHKTNVMLQGHPTRISSKPLKHSIVKRILVFKR